MPSLTDRELHRVQTLLHNGVVDDFLNLCAVGGDDQPDIVAEIRDGRGFDFVVFIRQIVVHFVELLLAEVVELGFNRFDRIAVGCVKEKEHIAENGFRRDQSNGFCVCLCRNADLGVKIDAVQLQ